VPADTSIDASHRELKNAQSSHKTSLTRSAAIADLILAMGSVLLCIPWASPRNFFFQNLSGLGGVLKLATFQFVAEGLIPLILMAVRHERLSDFGFSLRNSSKSLAFASVFAIMNNLGVSWHARDWLWMPFRRHSGVRMSLLLGFPENVLGVAVTVAIWGFLEAFFGVFIAKRVNQMLGSSGKGWLSAGALAFALFNGSIHLVIGQSWPGFLTSFASGYVIGVIPALTENAWGSAVFQSLTNSVGKI
jgi:hypothetical protein